MSDRLAEWPGSPYWIDVDPRLVFSHLCKQVDEGLRDRIESLGPSTVPTAPPSSS